MSEPNKGFTETLQEGKTRWQALLAALAGLSCEVGETTSSLISVSPSIPVMSPGTWWDYFTGYDSDGENPQTVLALKNAGVTGGWADFIFKGSADDKWSVIGDWLENYLTWKNALEASTASGGALVGFDELEAAVSAMQEWLNTIRPWKNRGGKERLGIW